MDETTTINVSPEYEEVAHEMDNFIAFLNRVFEVFKQLFDEIKSLFSGKTEA